jgi:signal transduction histidine kinase
MQTRARKSHRPPGRAVTALCCCVLLPSLLAVAQTNPPSASAGETTVLTTAREVQLLSREAAARRLRAIIRGVVTCYLPDSDSMVVQDKTRGIYINQVRTVFTGDAPRLGETFEVEGVTDPGQFAPALQARKVTRIGPGELPAPASPTWDQLINGSFDTQFIEIQGIVTAVGESKVNLLTHGGKIAAQLFGTVAASNGPALSRYLNAHIRLRGCMFATWDPRSHQVRVGVISLQVAAVEVDEPAPADLFAVVRKHPADLKLFDPEASLLHRVLVGGLVLQEHQGEFLAMDGADGFRFRLAQPAVFAPGDAVEVVGFPSLTGPSPVLQEAVARKIGSASLPPPRLLDLDNLFAVGNDATRVRIEGVLQGFIGDRQILELQTGLARFLALLELPGTAPRSPQPQVGSRVQLTGVYAGRGGNPDSGEVGSFELLVDSPADILVLERPPFWTLARLLILSGALASVLLIAIAWIRLLHQQVRERTSQLQKEIGDRERAEHQHALAMERSRIARDLHDDLGSSLTEIALLATADPGQPMPGADAIERLDGIAGKSRALLHALDEIVWAADPERDSLASLARYLASYAEEFLAGLKVTCRVQLPTTFPDQLMPGQVRHHLFLAVKETLSNAVRHGAATEVTFRMELQTDGWQIVLADNGRGFDLAHTPAGHGLPNLRSRLEKIGGRFQVASSPGAGTTVTLHLPLPSIASPIGSSEPRPV